MLGAASLLGAEARGAGGPAAGFFAGFNAVFFFEAGLRAAVCFFAGARFFMPRNLHERSGAVKRALFLTLPAAAT